MSQSLYVDKFYEMDPQFEDLLPDGTYLRDGMIVLIEDSFCRANVDAIENKYELERAKEANRWATVSHIQIHNRFEYNQYGEVEGNGSPLISFIATYGDGTKKKRTYDSSYAWIVKLESM